MGMSMSGTYRETGNSCFRKSWSCFRVRNEAVSHSAKEPVALEQLAADWLVKQKSQIKEASLCYKISKSDESVSDSSNRKLQPQEF